MGYGQRLYGQRAAENRMLQDNTLEKNAKIPSPGWTLPATTAGIRPNCGVQVAWSRQWSAFWVFY